MGAQQLGRRQHPDGGRVRQEAGRQGDAITAAAGTTTPAQGAGYLSTTTLYATAGPADPAELGAAAGRLDDVEGVRTVALASMEVPRGSGSSGSSGSFGSS